jgi:ankyrin repeat protein
MPSSAEADVRQYKLTLLKAAAENKAGPLRPFLQEGRIHWDDVRNKEHQNILHVASLEGSEDVVDMLLNDKRVQRKLDAPDRARRSALHLASAMGFDKVAQRLLKANAQIDLPDDTGCTALHLAVRFEWTDTVRILLEAGADPLLEDSKGKNALDIARTKENPESATMMSAWAGRRRQLSTFEGLARCIFPGWREEVGPR